MAIFGDSSGATALTERILADINARAARALPLVAEALLSEIKSRTPTKDEEYDALMRGDGNPSGVQLVPRDGDRSGDTDGRIRLQKEPGTWLEEVNASPNNVKVDTESLTLFIGNLTLLFAATHWRYKNIKYDWHRDYGPYFDAFEYGSVDAGAYVEPRWPAVQGGKYPLRPDEDEELKIFGMYKPIRARGMYNSFYFKRVLDSTMTKVLSE